MLIAAIVVFCLIVLVLAFVLPRGSRHVEGGGHKVLGTGARAGSKAPGKLGRWLAKPFSTSDRAVSKSGRAGRKGRGKMPL